MLGEGSARIGGETLCKEAARRFQAFTEPRAATKRENVAG